MKWFQFLFILAAIYTAPNMSKGGAMFLAAAFTIVAVYALWRKE